MWYTINIRSDLMDFEKTTYEYYAYWLGVDYNQFYKEGVFFIYNPERDKRPLGYSHTMDIYVFMKNDTIIISYGNRAKEKIDILKNKVNKDINIEALKRLFETTFNKDAVHSIKYVYKNSQKCQNDMIKNNAIALNESYYEMYLDYFKATRPDCSDYSWVKEHFSKNISKHSSYGIIIDNKLVSVADLPEMPYMQEKIQEIGIYTREEYYRKGYAKNVCTALINELLSKRICPIWSREINNIASDGLAKNIGFEKLADVLYVYKE
jgi:hypothetical protein